MSIKSLQGCHIYWLDMLQCFRKTANLQMRKYQSSKGKARNVKKFIRKHNNKQYVQCHCHAVCVSYNNCQ